MNSLSRDEAGGVRDDRILPEVRWTAVVVILVLLTAVVVLYALPDRTGELFAWKITPQMSAIFLGAGYAGGAWFFIRVALESRWHTVANIFVPTTIFVWFMLAATLLHLDRFSKDTPAFNLWIIIYLITPILVPFLWYRNRVTDPHIIEPDDITVPASVRVAAAVIGAGAMVLAILLFVLPQFGTAALDIWPWKLTPLTARVTAAAISFPAAAWMVLARDSRWSAWRIPLEVQVVALGLALLGIPRAWDNFDPNRLATWVFIGVLLVLVAATVFLYVSMESRRRAEVATEAVKPA
ncbi:MAG: hypothetical protein ABI670_21520 [Chloroflexota bacterium]